MHLSSFQMEHQKFCCCWFDDTSTHTAVFVTEIAIAYLTLSLSQSQTQNNDWKLVSLAALIELVSQIEQTDQVADGCRVVANELVRHLGASQVAVGFVSGGHLQVESLSGTAKLDRASDNYHGLEMAMNESLLRGDIGMHPPREEDESHLLIAHRQLGSRSFGRSRDDHSPYDTSWGNGRSSFADRYARTVAWGSTSEFCACIISADCRSARCRLACTIDKTRPSISMGWPYAEDDARDDLGLGDAVPYPH